MARTMAPRPRKPKPKTPEEIKAVRLAGGSLTKPNPKKRRGIGTKKSSSYTY